MDRPEDGLSSPQGIDLEEDRLHEECGVFGIFGHPDAAAITALGLHALQHRGQEAAGICSFDGKRFHSERRMGLVGDNFSRREVIDRLPGPAAIGHNRYSTTGETILRNVQPLFCELDGGGFAIGHNGNLTNGLTLRKQLVRDGAIMQSTSDSEVILHLVAQVAAQPLHRPLHRRAAPARGRLLVRRADQQEADRRARSARHPPAGDRRARRPSDPRLGNLRARHHRRALRARRGERRSRGVRRERRAVAQAVPADAGAARASSNTSISRGPDSIVGGRAVYDVRKTMGAELAQESAVPRRRGGAGAGLRRAGRDRLCAAIRHALRARHHPQSLCRAHLHRADAADPPARRAPEALGEPRRGERQAHRAGRRLDRARHHLDQDRADDARRRRDRGAFPHRLAADHASGLLRHRHAGARQAARRDAHDRGDAAHHRRGLARVPLGRGHLPRDGPDSAIRSGRSSPITASPATTRRR